MSPKSNRSNFFKCTKESGIDPIKFSLSSNDVKFVNLREEEKNHYYLRNIGKGKKSFWIDKKIYNSKFSSFLQKHASSARSYRKFLIAGSDANGATQMHVPVTLPVDHS